MQLQIINDKKLNWSYVKKVMVKVTDETFNYEAPLSLQEIQRIHFLTGALLQDYYSQDKK